MLYSRGGRHVCVVVLNHVYRLAAAAAAVPCSIAALVYGGGRLPARDLFCAGQLAHAGRPCGPVINTGERVRGACVHIRAAGAARAGGRAKLAPPRPVQCGRGTAACRSRPPVQGRRAAPSADRRRSASPRTRPPCRPATCTCTPGLPGRRQGLAGASPQPPICSLRPAASPVLLPALPACGGSVHEQAGRRRRRRAAAQDGPPPPPRPIAGRTLYTRGRGPVPHGRARACDLYL